MPISRRTMLRTSMSTAAFCITRSFAPAQRERRDCELLIAGGSLGGVAAALAAARLGRRVILTEESAWIGGQAVSQGVPLDEHPWAETMGRTETYARFRRTVRAYYREYYPLSGAAKADPYLNPGAGWVSACGFEPRAGLAALYEMLAPYLSSGQILLYTRFQIKRVEVSGDVVRAATFLDLQSGREVTFEASYFLDATDLGELLPLAKVEFVTGAESAADTHEPTALQGPAQPLHMQGFTHLIAVDHLPGEEHVIEKPALYEQLRGRFANLQGIAAPGSNELVARNRSLFARPELHQYVSSLWNFRRVLYAGNFAKGAFPSDITMFMNGNECDNRPLIGVSEQEARENLAFGKQLSLSLLYFLQTEILPGYGGKAGYPGLRARGDVFDTSDGLAQYPYIRESRRIKAVFTILEQHFRVDQRPAGPMLYDDSVGLSGYRMDIHEKGSRGGSRTLELNGKHWVQQIPLGALIPIRVENLLPASKNIGTTHVTNGAYRVHITEWNVGESAGALAAFCVARKVKPRHVHETSALRADLQRQLAGLGVPLAWPKPLVAASYNSHYATVRGWYFGEANLRFDSAGHLRE